MSITPPKNKDPRRNNQRAMQPDLPPRVPPPRWWIDPPWGALNDPLATADRLVELALAHRRLSELQAMCQRIVTRLARRDDR